MGWEEAQSAMYLPYKHEDLNSIFRTHVKKQNKQTKQVLTLRLPGQPDFDIWGILAQ